MVAHVDVMPTMLNGANTPAGHNARSGHSKDAYVVPVAFDWYASESQSLSCTEECPPLKTTMQPAVQQAMMVRRLTPRECERLQGFSDNYTAITYNRKPAKDGPRYKALGNSMAVPVVRWIGERIAMVEAL
jgi:site-specific DNA-cytosine methylase